MEQISKGMSVSGGFVMDGYAQVNRGSLGINMENPEYKVDAGN